jgi:thioredoxin reductase (NADPH)
MYDLIIVGAGPIGLVCGIEAKKAGLRFLIIEKGFLVNSIYHFPTNMTFFSTSILLEIGEIPFISHQDKPTRSEALEYYRRIVQAYQLPIHFQETVLNLARSGHPFELITDKANYTCRNLVFATGFYDRDIPLDIPGENLDKVAHYYREAHPYFQQKLAIIGGGNSACDAALECWQKGAEVSLIVRKQELKEGIKYWIRPNIENRIKEGSIRAYFGAELKAIKPDCILIEQNGTIITIPNDYVLALTGYQPDFELLTKFGIEYQSDGYRTPVYDEESLETTIPHLYLAGVVLGGCKTNRWFIETTRDHGKKIIDNILKKTIVHD